MRWVMSLFLVVSLSVVGCNSEPDNPLDPGGRVEAIEWAASIAPETDWRLPEHFGFGIGVSNSESPDVDWLTDGALDDYKPVYSPDGSQIAAVAAEWRARAVR